MRTTVNGSPVLLVDRNRFSGDLETLQVEPLLKQGRSAREDQDAGKYDDTGRVAVDESTRRESANRKTALIFPIVRPGWEPVPQTERGLAADGLLGLRPHQNLSRLQRITHLAIRDGHTIALPNEIRDRDLSARSGRGRSCAHADYFGAAIDDERLLGGRAPTSQPKIMSSLPLTLSTVPSAVTA